MHRSSENVAAIATALAKAQTELSNPEKAMVGMVYNNRTDSPQNFRYASLSSGLDIIRKTLGGHQIAIAQTTDLDRPGGMVNLTTVLMHTSGEWISSEWPVCRLSEMSAPRRMGAALTYARRYALFSMVGIAGDDDLDDPEFNSGPDVPRPSGERKSGTEVLPLNEGAVRPPPHSQTIAAQPIVDRQQIEAEIETAGSLEELQARAKAILKSKNALSSEDAKSVESAFAAKFVMLQKLTVGASFVIEADSNPSILMAEAAIEPPQTPKRRGRPPKKRIETIAAKIPHDVIDQASSHTVERISPEVSSETKIQKSELTISEVRRRRDKGHLRFVASQPCLICDRSPCDAHHLRFAQPRAMGKKNSDEFTVPLCRAHHRDNHRYGIEPDWWQRAGIDPLEIAAKLWSKTRSAP